MILEDDSNGDGSNYSLDNTTDNLNHFKFVQFTLKEGVDDSATALLELPGNRIIADIRLKCKCSI